MAEFGNHSVGATGFDNPADNVVWCKATTNPAGNGTLNFISFNGRAKAGSPTVEAAIYSDNSGAPGNRLAQSAGTVSPTSQAWYNVTMPSQALTGGTQYWLALRVTNYDGATNDVEVAYDSVGTNELFFINAVSFPANGSGSTGVTERWSIYADYTPDAATYNAVPLLHYYRSLRRGIFH